MVEETTETSKTKYNTGDSYVIQIMHDMLREYNTTFLHGQGKIRTKNKILDHLGQTQSTTQ